MLEDAMFEGWGEYYLMAGSAAAVLIGLIFVVISLMQDRSRSSVLFGSRLYMGPIVLHMSFVLVLSGAALAPGVTAGQFAAACGVVALWGLARGVISTLGIQRLKGGGDPPHWTDLWFYGVIPSAIYTVLGAVALGFRNGAEWATQGVAAMVVALILLSVRNEWDLVTWLAPKADEAPE
jgi:hypothetical protein